MCQGDVVCCMYLKATVAHPKAHGVHVDVIRERCPGCLPVILEELLHKRRQSALVFEDLAGKQREGKQLNVTVLIVKWQWLVKGLIRFFLQSVQILLNWIGTKHINISKLTWYIDNHFFPSSMTNVPGQGAERTSLQEMQMLQIVSNAKDLNDRTTEYVKIVFTSLLKHYDNLLRSNGNVLWILCRRKELIKIREEKIGRASCRERV